MSERDELLSWLERQLEGCLSYAMEIGDIRHTTTTRALERDLHDALEQIRRWHADGAPILAEEKQTGFPGSKPEAAPK